MGVGKINEALQSPVFLLVLIRSEHMKWMKRECFNKERKQKNKEKVYMLKDNNQFQNY